MTAADGVPRGARTEDDPTRWEFARQRDALASGELTSVELVSGYLARIAAHNDALNAIITLDADGALATAAACDDARRAARDEGAELGPLHGVPITLKDSYETRGLRTVCGQPRLANYIPEHDAEPVARLRRAGAVILGKTNMPTANADVQSSNPVFGRSNNPWALDRTPGGSAGGGAAAAAAALTPLDYGSEIGGSTRIPAHYCGIFGHKVTYRSVPLIGHLPPGPGTGRWVEPDMACAGMQSRDPEALLAAVEATVGAHPRDGGFSYDLLPSGAASLKGLRVGIWDEDPSCPVDADVQRALADVREVLRDAGASITEQPREIPTDLEASHRIFEQLLYAAFSTDRSTLSPRSVGALLARAGREPRGQAARCCSERPRATEPGSARMPLARSSASAGPSASQGTTCCCSRSPRPPRRPTTSRITIGGAAGCWWMAPTAPTGTSSSGAAWRTSQGRPRPPSRCGSGRRDCPLACR